MADGGEGTVQSLVAATGGKIVRAEVVGPLGETVMASYGILGDGTTAVIEMAEGLGSPARPARQARPSRDDDLWHGPARDRCRKPWHQAVHHRHRRFGNERRRRGVRAGSWHRIHRRGGEVIREPLGGGRLKDVVAINLASRHPASKACGLQAACDVSNRSAAPRAHPPSTGLRRVRRPSLWSLLDQNLAHIAAVMARDHGIDVAATPGAGGGGGLVWGLLAFVNATLKSASNSSSRRPASISRCRARSSLSPAKAASTAKRPSARRPPALQVGKAPRRACDRDWRRPLRRRGGSLRTWHRWPRGLHGKPHAARQRPQEFAPVLASRGRAAARFIALGLSAASTATASASQASDCDCDETAFTPDLNRPVKRAPRPKRIVGRTANAVYLSSRIRNKDA